MIKHTILIGLLLLCISRNSQAQNAYFPTKGVIKFEKEVYTKARMREMMSKFSGSSQNQGMMMSFRGNIDDMPEKNVSNFTLQFDENETLMLAVATDNDTRSPRGDRRMNASTSVRATGGGGGGGRGMGGGGGAMQMGTLVTSSGAPVGGGGFRGGRLQSEKVFYQNLKTQEAEISFELDEKYLLKDSLQKVTWRFTDEYRTIAGYECRRVNGATADSLYLVAFYTDLIPVSGGPALVNGLPGMVLGLVIPEMHINYWATSVDFTLENMPKDWRDKKVKNMSMEDFFKTLSGNRMFGGGAAAGSKQLKRNLLENLIY